MPTPRPPQLSAWGHSRLKKWERCPLSAKFAFIDKVPEPQSEAMAEGQRIHALAYGFLQEPGSVVPEELRRFEAEFVGIRSEGAMPEREWAFDKDWVTVEWFSRSAWLRIKVDAVLWKPPVLTVIDFKTGAPRVDDWEQIELYALGAFMRTGECASVHGLLWYLADGVEMTADFSRDSLPDMREKWLARVAPMLSDTTFAPTPGRHCRFCAYRADAGGPCKYDREGVAEPTA